MTAVIWAADAPLRRVDHQQQLHQVLLRRRHERLHDVDVALAAVGLELGLQAVVAEPLDLDRRRSDPEGLRRSLGPAGGGHYR